MVGRNINYEQSGAFYISNARKNIWKINRLINYFKKLPPELIEYLFTFLDGHSLKNCCLVDKLFNEVIADSAELMSRFTLLADGRREDIKEVAELTRRYTKIEIWNLKREEYEDVFRGSKVVGQKAAKVTISKCDLPEDNQLLTCFPNVVKLYLVGSVALPEIIEQSSLPKLKHLQFEFEEVNIRKFKNFKRLELINAPCKKESLDDLVEMLQNQTSLDTLLLTNISENLKLDLHPYFKVRRLFIEADFKTWGAFDFVLQFLGRIECISFLGGGSNEANFNKIVQNFTTIKALEFSDEITEGVNFYHTTKVNTNLSDLVLGYGNSAALLGSFKLFPNLKHLTVSSLDEEEIDGGLENFLSTKDCEKFHNQLKQLKSLTVDISYEYQLNIAARLLRNITQLYFRSLDDEGIWPERIKFLDAFTNLKFMSIVKEEGTLTFESQHFESVLDNFPTLETLQFGPGIFKKKFLKTLRFKGNNLKSLQLVGSTSEEGAHLNKKLQAMGICRNVVTTIPDDGSTNFFETLSGAFKMDYLAGD